MRYRYPTFWIAVVAVCLIPVSGTAAKQIAEVSVDDETIQLGATTTYSIKINQENQKSVRIERSPSFPSGLSVSARRRSSRLLIRGKKRIRKIEKNFTIRGVETGTHTIEPPIVRVGDQKIRLDRVKIKVKERTKQNGSTNQQHGKRNVIRDGKIFIQSSLPSGKSFYVGEQIPLYFDLFVDKFRINVRPSIMKEPTFHQFWLENVSSKIERRMTTVRVGGRLMHRRRMRYYLLFPLEAGSHQIEPLKIRLQEVSLLGGSNMQYIESNPISVDIESLPEDGKPDEFEPGNIGQWSFSINLDVGHGQVGQPLEFEMVAEGSGNPHRLTLPSLPEITGVRILNRETETEKDFNGELMTGKKTKTVALLPTNPGDLKLPDISFSYFDPDTEKYRTDTVDPASFNIREGTIPERYRQKNTPESSPKDSPKETNKKVITAARFEDTELRRAPTSEVLSKQAWIIGAGIPFLGMLFIFLYPSLTRIARKPLQIMKQKYGKRQLLSKFKDWMTEPPSAEKMHRETLVSLRKLLELAPGQTTRDEIFEKLNRRDLPEETIESIGWLLDQLSDIRYNPDAEASEKRRAALASKLHNQMTDLIDELD